MTARELLGAAIRAYGLYLFVSAVLGVVALLTEFVFGDARFGEAFRFLVKASAPAVAGLLMMKRAAGILTFMGLSPDAQKA
jgi:hypothetical protein